MPVTGCRVGSGPMGAPNRSLPVCRRPAAANPGWQSVPVCHRECHGSGTDSESEPAAAPRLTECQCLLSLRGQAAASRPARQPGTAPAHRPVTEPHTSFVLLVRMYWRGLIDSNLNLINRISISF